MTASSLKFIVIAGVIAGCSESDPPAAPSAGSEMGISLSDGEIEKQIDAFIERRREPGSRRNSGFPMPEQVNGSAMEFEIAYRIWERELARRLDSIDGKLQSDKEKWNAEIDWRLMENLQNRYHGDE